jgi:hypothetical protein
MSGFDRLAAALHGPRSVTPVAPARFQRMYPVTVDFPGQLLERLERAALAQEVTRAHLMRLAVSLYLDAVEAVEREETA